MSTISGLETIESNLGRKRDDLDPGDKAKLDIFMSLYGEFDPTNKDAITTAENIITNIECEFVHISTTRLRGSPPLDSTLLILR